MPGADVKGPDLCQRPLGFEPPYVGSYILATKLFIALLFLVGAEEAPRLRRRIGEVDEVIGVSQGNPNFIRPGAAAGQIGGGLEAIGGVLFAVEEER